MMAHQHLVAVAISKTAAITVIPAEIDRMSATIAFQAKTKRTGEIRTIKAASPDQMDAIKIADHITQLVAAQTYTTVPQVGIGVGMR